MPVGATSLLSQHSATGSQCNKKKTGKKNVQVFSSFIITTIICARQCLWFTQERGETKGFGFDVGSRSVQQQNCTAGSGHLAPLLAFLHSAAAAAAVRAGGGSAVKLESSGGQ